MHSLEIWERGFGAKERTILVERCSQPLPFDPSLLSWPRIHVGSYRGIHCAYSEMSFCSPQITACQNWMGSSVLKTYMINKETEAQRWGFSSPICRTQWRIVPGSCSPGSRGHGRGGFTFLCLYIHIYKIFIHFCVLNQWSSIGSYCSMWEMIISVG